MKRLTSPRMDRCIGCQCCSLACARLVHGQLSWRNAGIHIRSSGGLTTGFEADICVVCDPPPCAIACPTKALSPRKGGGVKYNKSLCIRCGACAPVCPVDAIQMDPADNLPYVCIHCGRCVPFCPHACIEMADISGEAAPDEENEENKENAEELSHA